MKFPRNTRLLNSPFEMAPFASVFFLLVIFVMLAAFLPTPGLPLQLPAAEDLPGTDKPTIAVAIDSNGRFYFENQMVANETELKNDLLDAKKKSPQPLTLVIQSDKAVTYEQLVRLVLLARDVGIQSALLATMPRIMNAPAKP
jgi:biopolymer transport protein ExbD